MSLIIRVDVDRPYGRQPLARHVLSRLSSDLWIPRVPGFGFLTELHKMLDWLNEVSARSYVFFRRCTLPSNPIIQQLTDGGHEIGLHLENSRSFANFMEEKRVLEEHVGRQVFAVTKHGSGGKQFGLHHYAPYEPEKYVQWAGRASFRLFLGNLQDPTLKPIEQSTDLVVFPSAFWLEPHWRDTTKFTVDWLIENAERQDIVLLVHPENVLADKGLVSDFKRLIRMVASRVLY